jgi:regulator of protease activity HflC (stomatin/prohibitin superfamily)
LKKAELKKKSLEEIEAELQEARRMAAELEAKAEAERIAAETVEKALRMSKKDDINENWKSIEVEVTTTTKPTTVVSSVPAPLSEKESRALRKKLLNEKWENAANKRVGTEF